VIIYITFYLSAVDTYTHINSLFNNNIYPSIRLIEILYLRRVGNPNATLDDYEFEFDENSDHDDE
jgi:hypothetical protein